MKTILTFFTALYFGFTVSAQEVKKIERIKVFETETTIKIEVKKRFPKRKDITRLYLFKNSRIKKELAFRTKANKAKLA